MITDLLTRLRRLLNLRPRETPVRRTVQHPRLGALHFEGTRRPPDDRVTRLWFVTPPGFARRISASLMTEDDGTPNAGDVAWLETFLADHDAFYARVRPALAEEYAHWVGGPVPVDWRAAFRLDSVDPPGDDVEDPSAWKVTYWCEEAQHWFTLWISDREVTDVVVDG